MLGWSRSRWVSLLVCTLTLVPGVVACGSDDGGDDGPTFETLEPDPSYPGTPADPARYAPLFDFTAEPGCSVSNPADLSGATELRIFQGAGVSSSDVQRYMAGLQRYYAQYGVTFSTRHEPIRIPTREALILDLDALARRVRHQTGIDIERVPPAQEEEALAAVGAAVFHNIREIIRVYGQPRQPLVNVVVLAEMVSGNLGGDLESLGSIAGLGVSPELLATVPGDDPAAQLYEWLGVTDDFTPIAIVGTRIIDEYLAEPDIIIAHEMGHAYGLEHVEAYGNLLNQGELECDLELDTEQLGRVAAATRGLGHSALESVSLTSRMGDLVRGLRRLAGSGAGAP